MSEKQYFKDLLEEAKNEVWTHKTSGEIAIVYERGETYARFHTNFDPEISLQGHRQMGAHFYRDYRFIGILQL